MNGREAGRFCRRPRAGATSACASPAAFWRRELNDVVLEPTAAGVLVDAVEFCASVPEGERGPRPMSRRAVVIGGGPAGLKAAHALVEGRRSR